MRALMELSAPKDDAVSLRNYRDYLESHVRSLKCLGQTQDLFGALLTPVIINKVTVEIRRNIEREHDDDNLTLQNLSLAINKEVKIFKAGRLKTVMVNATFLTRAYKKHKKTRDSTLNFDTTEIKSRPCIFCCTENHLPADCRKVADAISRFNIFKQKKMCLNCLGKHRASELKSRYRYKCVRINTTQVYVT